MDKILISPAEIESCWEKNDACFVKTKTGKVWICVRDEFIEFGDSQFKIHKNTLQYISSHKDDALIELSLLKGGNRNGK